MGGVKVYAIESQAYLHAQSGLWHPPPGERGGGPY